MKVEAHIHTVVDLTQDELTEAVRDFLKKRDAKNWNGEMHVCALVNTHAGSGTLRMTEGVQLHLTEDIPMEIQA